MNFINISDLTNPETGKTYREENNEKQHKFNLGDLIEVIDWDEDCEYDGMRLYIIGLVRDCDGTPLYVLGSKGMRLYQDDSKRFYNMNSFSGFGESALKLIKSA